MKDKILKAIEEGLRLAINETYGIAEFGNSNFINKITEAASSLRSESLDKCIIKEISDNIKFNKITINLRDTTEWIDYLDVYYSFDYNDVCNLFHGESIVVDQYRDLKKYIDVSNSHIKRSSIFLAVDLKKPNFIKVYSGIILHELGHLYTNKNLKEYHLSNKDLENHFMENVNDYVERLNVDNNFSSEDLWNIFTYTMYYANLSESHAFMENINFEMIRTLSNAAVYRLNLTHKKIEKTRYNLFVYSSGILQIYCWLYDLLKACELTNDSIKNEFDNIYHNDIYSIYGKHLSCNKLIKKYQKIIGHILKNSAKLYSYYAELYNVERTYLMEKGIFPEKMYNRRIINLE